MSFCFVPDTREDMEDREINKALTKHVFIYLFLTNGDSDGSLKKKKHRVLLNREQEVLAYFTGSQCSGVASKMRRSFVKIGRRAMHRCRRNIPGKGISKSEYP